MIPISVLRLRCLVAAFIGLFAVPASARSVTISLAA
jgi:hypothetical protein